MKMQPPGSFTNISWVHHETNWTKPYLTSPKDYFSFSNITLKYFITGVLWGNVHICLSLMN